MSTAFQPADRTAWDELLMDPTTVELSSLDEPDIQGWEDLTGIDLEEFSADAELTESVGWLHSLLYSDYQDPADDEDRAEMNIPRHILDSL